MKTTRTTALSRSITIIAAIAAATLGHSANASFIVTLQQVGGDVVGTGSGNLNTSGLLLLTNGTDLANLWGAHGELTVGPVFSMPINAYGGSFSGPATIGTGAQFSGTSGSGTEVGIDGFNDVLYVQNGYTSGAPLSDTTTWSGQTFSSLGITTGTYTWNVGTETFVVNAVAPTPEPTSAVLLLGSAGMFAGFRRFGRKANP